MPSIPRVPPRFVPTLTEVVNESAVPTTADSARPNTRPERPAASTAPISEVRVSSPRTSLPAAPAHPIGALGSVVRTKASPPPPHPAETTRTEAAKPILSKDFEELLVHRVMQRVDISLDIRLRGAIATVVEEQTRSIVPRLREEIEAVVRHAVYEAVADELAADVKIKTPPV